MVQSKILSLPSFEHKYVSHHSQHLPLQSFCKPVLQPLTLLEGCAICAKSVLLRYAGIAVFLSCPPQAVGIQIAASRIVTCVQGLMSFMLAQYCIALVDKKGCNQCWHARTEIQRRVVLSVLMGNACNTIALLIL